MSHPPSAPGGATIPGGQRGVTVIEAPGEISRWSDEARARGERIVFVPTMGALHAGHVSLLQAGRQRGDRLVLSIFVNPTQFGPREDLDRYPRDRDGDLAKAGAAGVDVAFVPPREAMYPAGHQTTVQVHQLEQGLCGAGRPGHFVGVATVVCKLFNIVRPHAALFGEKDFQQLAVIRRMVRDLDMPVEVISAPTVREPDGLAMSSRNRFLSAEERLRALSISGGLTAARRRYQAGDRDAAALVACAREVMQPAVDRIEYIDLRDAEELGPLTVVDGPAVLLAAAFVGTTRLIDNVRLG